MLISVVIPCYNSENTIKEVVELTKIEIIKLGYDYEFILVDDNSKDETFEKLREICENDVKIKAINLSRNFGQHNAIMAGLNYITGDLIIGMDDDLQTHPSQIPFLMKRLNEGFDIVFGAYSNKKHSALRNIGSRFNLWTVRILTGKSKDLKTSSFWIAKKFIIDEVIKYVSPYPHISGLFFRVTKKIGNVNIQHFERENGSSNYTLKKLIKQWSAFTNFSIIPLRIALVIGILLALIGFIGALIIVIRRIVGISTYVGWASTMVAILFFSGINLIFLGTIGEYLGRLFMSSNCTPQYVIREKINFR